MDPFFIFASHARPPPARSLLFETFYPTLSNPAHKQNSPLDLSSHEDTQKKESGDNNIIRAISNQIGGKNKTYEQQVREDGAKKRSLNNVNLAFFQGNDGQNQFHGVSKGRVQQGTKVLFSDGSGRILTGKPKKKINQITKDHTQFSFNSFSPGMALGTLKEFCCFCGFVLGLSYLSESQ